MFVKTAKVKDIPILIEGLFVKTLSPMNLFYFSRLNDGIGILEGEEAKHCVRVLRQQKGDEISGVDGKGNFHTGTITQMSKTSVEVSISETISEWGEHDFDIRIITSPLRLPDRFEWLVEKAVELGATSVEPVILQRTVKPSIRMERLTKIMVSALKQCKRSRLPDLKEPTKFQDFLEEEFDGLKFIASADAEEGFDAYREQIRDAGSISYLIGPEGDFSPQEYQQAVAAGFKPMNLGTNRLRAETAVIHFLSGIKYTKGY